MSENTRDRTNQSLLATQFLKDQLETAKKELDAIEDKMTKFRTTYAGRLPDQIQSNQMQLNTLEQRISNLNANISRVSQEKLLLESELRTVKTQQASLQPAPESLAMQVKNERLVMAERDIQSLENSLAVLREHYKDTYPEVKRVLSQLNVARKNKENILKEEEAKKAEPNTPAPKRYDPYLARELSNSQATMERLNAQMKSKDLQAEDYMKEMKQVEGAIRLFQGRIEAAPVGEQQYAEVIRDHEIGKLKYEDLNRKMSQSQISSELEKRQQGETLEVLDPASLPQTPTQPKRPIVVAIGVAIGIVLGLFFAGAREAKDTSLKNLKDVRAYTQLTILGSVPLLENDLVVRRRKRLAWLAWSTACLVGIVIMTGSVFYYYTTKV
jgi:succinoglycan biosynthesis transport protein ExoP